MMSGSVRSKADQASNDAYQGLQVNVTVLCGASMVLMKDDEFLGAARITQLQDLGASGRAYPALADIDPARLQSAPNLEFAIKPVSANTLLSYVERHHRLK